MIGNDKSDKINEYWSEKAQKWGLDPRATTFDFNQKMLEVDDILSFLTRFSQPIRILDVGCGTGYLSCEMAKNEKWTVDGADYSEAIIEICNKRRQSLSEESRKRVSFRQANVLSLPHEDRFFDVVIGERILVNLPSLKLKKNAVQEIARVLKTGGFYLSFEGSKEGIKRLNDLRKLYGLYEIPEHWTQTKIEESTFIPFLEEYFNVVELKRYGMFYFISRIIHPLLVHPEEPKYDAKINEVARQMATITRNYKDIGHLLFLTLERKRLEN